MFTELARNVLMIMFACSGILLHALGFGKSVKFCCVK